MYSFLEDIFQEGEVGGHCQFNEEVHHGQGEHKSPLQSWFAELGPYTALDFKPTSSKHCDEIITKPIVFIKLDAGIYMKLKGNIKKAQNIHGRTSQFLYS